MVYLFLFEVDNDICLVGVKRGYRGVCKVGCWIGIVLIGYKYLRDLEDKLVLVLD